jgi:hypothetical protein
VAIVLGVAGYKWNEARQIANARAAGAQFEAAAELVADNKPEAAVKAFNDIVKGGPPGYGVLAGLREAGELAKTGKTREAVATFDRIALSSPDKMLAELARLGAASLRLGTADFAEMQNRLKPLMAEQAPFRFSAHELMGLAALKDGKIADARAALEPLVGNPRVPSGVAQRAQVLMSQVAAAELASGKTAGQATPAGTTDGKASATPPAGETK